MKNIGLSVVLLASAMLMSACQFSNKSNLLMPTAPSSFSSAGSGAAASSGGSSASSSASSSTSSAPSTPAAAGTWASGSIPGLPNIGSCTNLQWQISSQTATAVAGSVSALCGGIVNVTANLSGEMSGSDVVQLTANGQAVGLGLTCVFSLNGTGHMQGSDAMKLDFQGTTCLGPVSGSEMLQRRAPAPPAPAPSAPEPEPAPQEQEPVPDDGAFGCSPLAFNDIKLVECIHEHINPRNEHEAFEVTKRVAWAMRGQGAGLLIKTTGENIVPWRGYVFAAGRICFPDGHILKIISDVGPGGLNGPSWQDNGYVDPKLYLPALDTTR